MFRCFCNFIVSEKCILHSWRLKSTIPLVKKCAQKREKKYFPTLYCQSTKADGVGTPWNLHREVVFSSAENDIRKHHGGEHYPLIHGEKRLVNLFYCLRNNLNNVKLFDCLYSEPEGKTEKVQGVSFPWWPKSTRLVGLVWLVHVAGTFWDEDLILTANFLELSVPFCGL